MPFGAISGLLGTILQFGQAQQNYYLQRNNYNWQRFAQYHTWHREDTSVQRRVADLKAAGLSPTLAAGSGAQASAPIHTNAPQKEMDWISAMSHLQTMRHQEMDMKRGNAQIGLTRAEENAIKLQTERERRNLLWTDAFNQLEYDSRVLGLRRDEQQYELDREMFLGRVHALINQNKESNQRQLQAEVDRQIAELQVTEQAIQNANARLQHEELGNRISLQDREIVAKQLAIEEKQYQLDWYRSRGLPVNAGPYLQHAGVLAGGYANAIERINSWWNRTKGTPTGAGHTYR